MATRKTTEVRSTGVRIPDICFGTSALGNMPDTYTYEVDEKRAVETIKTILASESAFIDTGRNYGLGRSEERIGSAIKELGGVPDGAIISTKLDRNMDTGLFNASEARRSIEESLAALGVDKVDILHLHDPEHAESLEPIVGSGGAIDELFKMRDEGLCRAVGLAAGNVEVMMPILEERDFDILITHNRYTLVNVNAEAMIALATDKNITVMNAAPFSGGVLAKGSGSFKRYVYQEASDEMLAPVKAVEAICEKHGIAPGAAALQFSLRERRITSTICGVSKPERIQEMLDWASDVIPDAAWDELLQLDRDTRDPEASREYKPG